MPLPMFDYAKSTDYGTSYALMSQWMNRKGSAQAYKKEPLPQTFAIAMQGNAAFPTRNPAFSAGSARQNYDFGEPVSQSMPDPLLHNVTAQNASIDENVPIHLRYNQTAGYDDFHKSFQQVSKQWPSKSYPDFGPPRLRHGRAGGSWRHVKEVLQAGGSRIVFVDGVIRWADGCKIDEIPAGHLINPRVGDIKSRYITPRQERPSGKRSPVGKTEFLAMNEFHRERPTIWRSNTDLPNFVSWGKSGL